MQSTDSNVTLDCPKAQISMEKVKGKKNIQTQIPCAIEHNCNK